MPLQIGCIITMAGLKRPYKGLPADAPVAIIGTELTGVDVVLRLRELGHRGKIIAVSRYGISRVVIRTALRCPTSAIPLNTPATAVAYLRALRAVIRAGSAWRAAVDSIRATTNELWLRLPLVERKRSRRHLQRRWDVVRHRMAPTIADTIDAEIARGSLEIREGFLQAADAAPNGAHVTIRRHDGSEDIYVNRVINCTGPSMNYRRIPVLLQNLFEKGLVTAGPLGTGFHCDENGAVIDAHGRVSEMIFNLGPGRLGDLIKCISVPEIRQQAVNLAATLNTHLPLPNATASENGNALTEAEVEGAWVVA